MIQLLKEIKNTEEIIIEENEKTFEITFPEMVEFYAQVLSVMESDAFVGTGVPEAFIKIDKEDYSVREFTTNFFMMPGQGAHQKEWLQLNFVLMISTKLKI
ncbi:hypothetical protein MKZ27_18990 [Bacillus sp. FSL R5-0394]